MKNYTKILINEKNCKSLGNWRKNNEILNFSPTISVQERKQRNKQIHKQTKQFTKPWLTVSM